ncbi:unnamed protein product [Ectocarpus sp. 12 AP-2014]
MALAKISEIARNQQKDFRSIERNRRHIDKNYEEIGELLDRIKCLEDRVEKLASSSPEHVRQVNTGGAEEKAKNKNKKKNKKIATTNNPSLLNAKLMEMKQRSAQLQVDRSALIKFSKMKLDLPESKRYTWRRVSKGATKNVKIFDSIVDGQSLESLLLNPIIKSVVDNILVPDDGPVLNITNNIRKKYWVFIKDGKLVTLSTDFRDGVGSEYLCTEDAYLGVPSIEWKNPIKRENDPRRPHVDPRTKVLWVPECEEKQVVPTPAEKGHDSSSSSDDESSSDDDGDDRGAFNPRDIKDDGDNGAAENDNNHGDDSHDRDAEHPKAKDNGDNGGAEDGKAQDSGDDGGVDDNGDDVGAENDSDESSRDDGGSNNDKSTSNNDNERVESVAENVDKDNSGNVSDLGHNGVQSSASSSVKSDSGNVSDPGDIGVQDSASSSMEVPAEVGVKESLSGNKRTVEEYAGTSSDSDSDSDDDDDDDDARHKMPRVM